MCLTSVRRRLAPIVTGATRMQRGSGLASDQEPRRDLLAHAGHAVPSQEIEQPAPSRLVGAPGVAGSQLAGQDLVHQGDEEDIDVAGVRHQGLHERVDINALRALAPLPRAPVPRPSRPQPRTPPPAGAAGTDPGKQATHAGTLIRVEYDTRPPVTFGPQSTKTAVDPPHFYGPCRHRSVIP